MLDCLCSHFIAIPREQWLERMTGGRVLDAELILQYGIATEDEIGIETFDRRWREEVLRQGSVIQWIPCVGAWARKRAAAAGPCVTR